MPQIKTGHFEADGNDVSLFFGYVPDYFLLIHQNAATDEPATITWFKDLGAGKEFQFVNVLAGTSSVNAFNYETSSAEIEAIVDSSKPSVSGLSLIHI